VDGRPWGRSFGRRHTVARSNGRRKTPRHRPSVLHLAACAVGLASRAAAAIPALRHHAVQGRWCDSQSRCFCVAECGCLTVCACVRWRSKLPTHPRRPPLCFRHAICRGCGVSSVALRCSWARVLMYGVVLWCGTPVTSRAPSLHCVRARPRSSSVCRRRWSHGLLLWTMTGW